jgi:hypothetical protein
MTKAVKLHEIPGQSIDGVNYQAAASGTGTVVTTTATQTLTNKTLTAPVLGGSITGTYTLAGTPTITAPTITAPAISGAATIADGATLTTPIITADVQAALAAAGSAQADAAAITVTSPGIVTSTGGNNAAGIRLPTGNTGDMYFIKNTAADILFVYPATNCSINAIAANTKINLATVTSAMFVKVSATLWQTIPTVPS